MQLSWVLLLPLALAAICPMKKHQVCNQDNIDHSCVCAVAPADDNAVPFQSCNNMIDRGGDDDDDDDDKSEEDDNEESFEGVSVTFKLDEHDGHEQFPEDQFKETISSSLRVDEEDILILRANCVEDEEGEDKFIVQFAILKKNNNETEMPYEQNDFIDAESIVTRMKAMGHLDKIADLDVDDIEFVKELIDIEQNADNTELIVQAIFVGAGFFLMFILGIFMCVRNQGYSDELQKA